MSEMWTYLHASRLKFYREFHISPRVIVKSTISSLAASRRQTTFEYTKALSPYPLVAGHRSNFKYNRQCTNH